MNTTDTVSKREGIFLQPDGQLLQSRWHREEGAPKGEYVTRSVTDRATEFLFDDVTLTGGVTVRSLFLLLQASPALVQVFRRSYAKELLLEALGPEPSYDVSGGVKPDEIEYAAVYRTLSRHSANRTLYGTNRLHFDGAGFVATEDVLEHGHVMCSAGKRERYGFSLTCVRHLLDLPLRLDTDLPVSEEDTSVEEYWTKTEHYQCDEARLGELIHAVLDELSWHGVGEQREAVVTDLAMTMADIEQNGLKNTRSLEEAMNELREKTKA